MKLNFLWKGLPGHPLHPPLTDATIGTYTFATGMAVLSRLGISEQNTATAWWLALIAGLALTAPTAFVGFADWLDISRGTWLWRTATLHLFVMVSATTVFAVAAGVGHGDYVDGTISNGSLLLTLIAYGVLALGGWLGGTIVFVYGMRVLNLVEEPTARAIAPEAFPEKEKAEGA